MKAFLKENIAIVGAIVLPLLLVMIFMVSTSITNIIIEDPRHDFLIATNYNYGARDALRFDVVQNKLVITYRYPAKDENNRYLHTKNAKLWRVHAPDMSIEEIFIPIPDEDDQGQNKSFEINVPGITDVKVVNIQPGPDGYDFESSRYYYNGNIMTELFSSQSRYRGAALIKDGRVIPIKGRKENKFRYNSQFIGWIIKE